MKIRPKNLYCYKENRTQKWIMTNDDNDNEILLNILMNPKVDKSSIFCIPAEGLMFGIIWLDKKSHSSSRSSIWDFFKEYNNSQTNMPKNDVAVKLAAEIKEESEFKHNSLFGFISPDGKYFHCDYQCHSALAHDICFGQYETTNPERCLEEHGWCKIYSPLDKNYKYAVYVGGNYVITDAQMKTLIELGLDNAMDITKMLNKD